MRDDNINHPWPFPQVLADEILSLRVSPEGIGLDQACINQKDGEENSNLISSMDIIYSSARRLVIVLEDVVLSEGHVQLVRRHTDTLLSSNSEMLSETPDLPIDFMHKLPEHSGLRGLGAFMNFKQLDTTCLTEPQL